MKINFLTIILIGLLASCGNSQVNLTSKTFSAETGKGCEMHINGGIDETYYMILKFQSENKVEIITKKVSLGSINGVKKDTTEIHKEGVFEYKIIDERIVIDGFNRFNGGFTINKLGGITAVDRVSEIDEKYYFKEKK